MEHLVWKGCNYDNAKEKYFVIGHSHYCEEVESRNPEFTRTLVRGIVEERWSIAFFTSIAKAFGYEGPAEFYKEVVFFNYLPECVGRAEDKFAAAANPVLEQAKQRFLRVLREHKPDRVFIFSSSRGKGWPTFPNTSEEEDGHPLKRLGEIFPKSFEWGTYDADGKISLACGIRHPLYAKNGQLLNAVTAFKQVPLP